MKPNKGYECECDVCGRPIEKGRLCSYCMRGRDDSRKDHNARRKAKREGATKI